MKKRPFLPWLITCLFAANLALLSAQSVSYMYITVAEINSEWKQQSFISVTEADGTQQKTELKDLSSYTKYLDLENIQANDLIVTQTLNKYSQKGWKIISTAISTGQYDGSSKFIMTRYILEKKDDGD